MAIHWLITFKNETRFALCRTTKYQACSNLYFFFRQPSNGHTEQCPAFAETLALSTS